MMLEIKGLLVWLPVIIGRFRQYHIWRLAKAVFERRLSGSAGSEQIKY